MATGLFSPNTGQELFFFVKAARLTRGPLILDLIDHDERLYNEIVLGSLEAIRRLSLKKFWLYFSLGYWSWTILLICVLKLNHWDLAGTESHSWFGKGLEIQRDDEAILAGFKGKWKPAKKSVEGRCDCGGLHWGQHSVWNW